MENLPANFTFANDQNFGWAKKNAQRQQIHVASLNRTNKGRWKRRKVQPPFIDINMAPMRNPPQEARFVPLEEHFENFSEVIGDVVSNFAGDDVSNFLGLGKKARARRAARAEVKNKKKLAKADLIQAKADAVRIAAQGEADAARAAAQQTAQTNQIAASTGNAPAQIQESPMYQTIPDNASRNSGNWADDNSQAETQETAAAKPAKKNNKTMIYIIIAVVVIAGIIFFMRKKK